MVEKSRDVPPSLQPKSGDIGFDLDRALESIVTVQSTIPSDAFTAQILGTERAGSGVVIGESGLVLTIGYLVTEAENVWLIDGQRPRRSRPSDRDRPGDGLRPGAGAGRSRFARARLRARRRPRVGDPVVMAGGGGGRKQSVRARIVAKQEFSGYWEYHLDEAIFTAPAHPLWGGAGLIGAGRRTDGRRLAARPTAATSAANAGRQYERADRPAAAGAGRTADFRPRCNKPPRPWLGVYSTENGGRVVIADVTEDGPGGAAGLRSGDIIASVRDASVETLSEFYREIWRCGPAGTEIPIEIVRDKRSLWVRVKSADRASFLKKPRLH